MYFKVQALVDLWTANGRSVVEKLKQRCLAPKQVNELYFAEKTHTTHHLLMTATLHVQRP